MNRNPDSLMWAHRIQQYALEDAVLFSGGYRAEYCSPTAKDRKRIAVMAAESFVDFRLMVTQLDRLVSTFDDPIIYTGGVLGEWNSYQNCLVIGWAKCNWYDRQSFEITKQAHRRNERLCNVCSHLAAFSNGDDERLNALIELARAEELKVKIIPYQRT